MNDILNPEEIEAIKTLKRLTDLPNGYVRRVLQEVSFDVESFTTSNFRIGHRAADWLLRVAEALVDQKFAYLVRNKYSFTTIDVVEAAEKAISEAVIECHEHWEDDPIDFVQCHPTVKIGENGPASHPWGDDEVALLRKWLAVRPYRVWAVQNAVQTAATEAMNEVLLDIATEIEDGLNIRRAAEEAFIKAVVTVRSELS